MEPNGQKPIRPTERRVIFRTSVPGPTTQPGPPVRLLIPAEQQSQPGPSGYQASWGAPGFRAPGSDAPERSLSAPESERKGGEKPKPAVTGIESLPVGRKIKREIFTPQWEKAKDVEHVVDISDDEEEDYVDAEEEVEEEKNKEVAEASEGASEETAVKEDKGKSLAPLQSQRPHEGFQLIGPEGGWVQMESGKSRYFPPGSEVMRADGIFCYYPPPVQGEGQKREVLVIPKGDKGLSDVGPAKMGPTELGPALEGVSKGGNAGEEVSTGDENQEAGAGPSSRTLERKDRRRYGRQRERVRAAREAKVVTCVAEDVALRHGGRKEVIGPGGEWMDLLGGETRFLPGGTEVIRGEGFYYAPPSSDPAGPSSRGPDTIPKEEAGQVGGVSRQMDAEAPPVPYGQGTGRSRRKRKAGDLLRAHQVSIAALGAQGEAKREFPPVLGEKKEDEDLSIFRYDERPYDPKAMPSYPQEVDLNKEKPGSAWYVLKVREQSQWLTYTDLPWMVVQESVATELPFRDLDIYLMYSLFRLRRLSYDEDFQKTTISSADKESVKWWERYRKELKDRMGEEALFLWNGMAFVMACAFVLRRAFKEEAFRDALLSMGVQTKIRGYSMVIREKYGNVLHWVRMTLILDNPPIHPDISQRYIIGDSMISHWGISYYVREGRRMEREVAEYQNRREEFIALEHGTVKEFRVWPISGADVRTVAWITQGILMPHTKAVVWHVGTNNVEAAPPRTKDDRTPAEKKAGPSREDDRGQKQWTNFPTVAFTLVHHARAITRITPTLGGLFLMEILPRFVDEAWFYRDPWSDGDTRQLPPRVRKVEEINRLVRQLASSQPEMRVAVMPTYDLADNPGYFMESGVLGLHIRDKARMWYILCKVVEAVKNILRQ